MSEAAFANRRVGHRSLLGERDELLEVLRWDLGIDDQHVRRGTDQRDRRDILDGVVFRRVEQRRRDERRRRGDAEGVTIRVGLRDLARADLAAGARTVHDNHCLVQLNRQLLGDDTRDRVRG